MKTVKDLRTFQLPIYKNNKWEAVFSDIINGVEHSTFNEYEGRDGKNQNVHTALKMV